MQTVTKKATVLIIYVQKFVVYVRTKFVISSIGILLIKVHVKVGYQHH